MAADVSVAVRAATPVKRGIAAGTFGMPPPRLERLGAEASAILDRSRVGTGRPPAGVERAAMRAALDHTQRIHLSNRGERHPSVPVADWTIPGS